MRSIPPPLMSTVSPSTSEHIALHSMCQPEPRPQGDAQAGSPGLDFFQSTKSFSARFSEASAASAPSPSIASSTFSSAALFSLAYLWLGADSNEGTSKYTDPLEATRAFAIDDPLDVRHDLVRVLGDASQHVRL